MDRACDNCGFETADLHVVRRVYVTPETWDTPASRRVIDETESWCTSCVTQYPHEAVSDPG
ncbi:MAG TPA: hypothetical protein VI916_11730 [Acidimicrobiia bacterium]|nr:hypothetical protein [Acidimicrobiia bacterium]